MAFDNAGLSKVAQFGGLTGCSMWKYDTLDTAADVDTAAYFTGEALKILRVGDVILRTTWATAIATGTISTMGFHIVNANSGTAIDLADTLAITVTDTD